MIFKFLQIHFPNHKLNIQLKTSTRTKTYSDNWETARVIFNNKNVSTSSSLSSVKVCVWELLQEKFP